MPNLKHLYYFYVFSKSRSITLAAKRLRITPPALSNQLKALEATLGTKLTQRSGRDVLFTRNGKIVLESAETMFTIYESFRHHFSDAGLKSSNFRVGISKNIGARYAFGCLSLLAKVRLSRSKNVHLSFDTCKTLLQAFDAGDLDFFLGELAPNPMLANHGIVREFKFSVQIFAPGRLMSRSDYKRAGTLQADPEKVIRLANKKKISLVLPMQPSVLRDETDHFLSKLKMRSDRIIECDSSSAIAELIESGFAFGFIPTPSLFDFSANKDILIFGLESGYWQHALTLYARNGPEKA